MSGESRFSSITISPGELGLSRLNDGDDNEAVTGDLATGCSFVEACLDGTIGDSLDVVSKLAPVEEVVALDGIATFSLLLPSAFIASTIRF